MTRRPPRHLAPRLLGCLAVAAPALAPLGAVAGRAAALDTPAVVVRIVTLTPVAPGPASRVVVTGTVRNAGDAVLDSVRVRLRASTLPVTSRSALAAEAADPGAVFGFPLSGHGAEVGALAPGSVAPYRLVLRLRRLALPGPGVYPFGVDVRAVTATGDEQTVGGLRTFLPYTTPGAPLRPSRVGWLMPLVDLPDRRADGSFPSERLAAEMGRGGRLAALVGAVATARRTASRRVPVTYAVDPALLEAAQAMVTGYSVHPPGQPTRPGTGQARARRFLDILRRLTAADPVLALPYGDPDVAALVRAGRDADVALAAAAPAFNAISEAVLGTATVSGLGWPPGGLLSRSVLDALPALDTVVLSGRVLPPQPDLTYTPDAAVTLPTVAGGSVTALVTDPTLDDLLAAPATDSGVRVAEQRFLAETLLITAERPERSRSLVLAPPRLWSPPPGYAAALLRDTGSVPWLRALPVPDLPAPDPAAPPRLPLTYPSDALRAELPQRTLTAGGALPVLADGVRRFGSILTDPQRSGLPELQRTVLRCESAQWRGRTASQRRLLADTAATLAGEQGRVRITSGGSVSLASRTGRIPVSVANGLDQAVRVQLMLRSNQARLVANDSGVRRVAAGHQVTVDVRVHASGAGVFPVYASLLTPDGRRYGPPVKLLVHSTGYGAVAVVITVAAVVVLVLAAAIRLTRRVRVARAGGPAP